MGIMSRIKNLFRKGGARMGVIQSLSKITDHPKINIDPLEYDRIELDKQYFKGEFSPVKYSNTYGDQKQRQYVSLNMMQVVCRRMASLLYNEQSKISIDTRKAADPDKPPTKKDAANDFVQSVLEANDFGKNFERYLESCLAMGGLAIRPYVDDNTGAIKLAWVQAPNFYPLRSNTSDVTSAAIATQTYAVENDRNVYYTLLEIHEWTENGYTISNELYRSEDVATVGLRVPLASQYPDLAEQTTVSPATRPLFVYLKPAGFNNKSLVSPLGVGLCDNALSTLKQINDTYDQFNWEVRMGQRKVGVPESMTRVSYTKNGKDQVKQYFDPDQNVFIATQSGVDGKGVVDLTSQIRSTDYIAALNQFFKTLEMQLGLSAGTFSFDGQAVKTATEVVSENSMTYQTRNSHLTMVERAIKELCVSICELASGTIGDDGKPLYSGPIPTVDQVAVDFDDGVFTDKGATADYWTKLYAAGLCSDWQAIMHIQGVTEDQARATAAEISSKAGNDAVGQDQTAGMFGGDGDGGDQ